MKTFLARTDLASFSLLVSYLIYLAFKNNTTIADGIIVLSLSSIYIYNQFLIQKEKPDYDKKIEELRLDMIKDVTKLRDDFSKFQMIQTKVTPIQSTQKIRF